MIHKRKTKGRGLDRNTDATASGRTSEGEESPVRRPDTGGEQSSQSGPHWDLPSVDEFVSSVISHSDQSCSSNALEELCVDSIEYPFWSDSSHENGPEEKQDDSHSAEPCKPELSAMLHFSRSRISDDMWNAAQALSATR